MLLNTWLSAARLHFSQRSATRRTGRGHARPSLCSESLEARTLLTALVINQDNKDLYLNATGGIVINNAALGTHDSLVVEGFQISASSGDALTILLSGKPLNSIAIESITVSQYSSIGFNIDLTNVTGLHTIAIEDVSIQGTTRGLELTMTNSDAYALTIDDSTIPGIKIDALSGGDIQHGLITESTIAAGAGVQGIVLNVNQGTADNFRIEDNKISSSDSDFISIFSNNAPLDGLSISNNEIGNDTQGAGISFRADGDTFVQPMVLSNNSTQGELLQTFVFDLSNIGLQFDTNTVTGKAFTPVGNSAVITGLIGSVVSPDLKTLTVTFNDFDPGESIGFVIDIDLAGGIASSVFGNDLIGADVSAVLSVASGSRSVGGKMIGDPQKITASQFAIGPGVVGAAQGINLNLTNSPTTNLSITGNSITAAPGFGLLLDANAFSDVTGVITNNTIIGSGLDGIQFKMWDSNFTGAVIGNNISNSGDNGISVKPKVTRSGTVDDLFDTNTVIITSENHGLVTGDQIMLQGVVNDDPAVIHPANGLHTVTVLGPDSFRLNLVDGTAPGVRYKLGGEWYLPRFQSDGTIRGLVTVDMQASVPTGTIRAATNAGPIVITSPNHGLVSGQRIRVSNVGGNTAANGVQKITVIDANTFSLDGATGNGTYDPSTGFGTWTANVITNATNSSNLLITSPGHGLQTGDEIRITGVLGNTAANGTFKVSVVDGNTFRLDNAAGNSTYGGGGNWVRLNDTIAIDGLLPVSVRGNRLPQRVSGNSITGNGEAGFIVNLGTGTVFNGDIVGNTISQNLETGITIESHSFGLGADLPLNPADPFALPGAQDISFNVNIGTSSTGDGNLLDGNTQAGISIEALDSGTGSFEIRNNIIVSSRDDVSSSTTAAGDGIVVRLTNDQLPTDSTALLTKSIIDGNTIGVDNQGNDGNGLLFSLNWRTRIQDLQLTNNTFLNNKLDGFHFERSDSAHLNSFVVEKNKATNNAGDGFDFTSSNTADDLLDFSVNENVIDDNAQYGVRINTLVDARISLQFDRNSVTGNGHTAGGTGFHPNDGVAGSTNAAGGVGIFGFQQANIAVSAQDSHIDNNFGDGLSIDAFRFFDTLILDLNFNNTTFNGNTLAGIRNHGGGFGHVDIVNSQFNRNGEDGFRSVSIEDKNDVFERRVGGMNIQLTSIGSQYVGNGMNGMKLGQGVSASLGNGTTPGTNSFDANQGAGLKITQSAGPFLMGKVTYTVPNSFFPQLYGAFQYVDRRQIDASTNSFRNNKGAGIDIGHFAQTEGGNVNQGDEVITDVHVNVSNAEIVGNSGDGIEYLADSVLRISPIVGGQQDVEYSHKSSLSVTNSRIVSNKKRGVDILNRVGEDSIISIVNSTITSNGSEGIYVVNTASHVQLQGASSDALDAYLERITVRSDDDQRFFSVGTVIREVDFEISPKIELRINNNTIRSNGSTTQTSTVPINVSTNTNNATGVANPDWTSQYRQIQGTLGGLVIRVGAADSVGRLLAADAPEELGLSGVDAEVYHNTFDGNVGADVYFDNYTSQIAAQSQDKFDAADTPELFRWSEGYRDPLSRFNLVFRENSGNSLDVINGFAYVDNTETEFKSREFFHTHAPNHGHDPPNPRGPFGHGYDRFRNQTRTTGYFNVVGDTPSSWAAITTGGVNIVDWSFDGWGTPTWRVESDFDFNRFTTADTTQGFSSFYNVTNLGISLAEEQFQWDTGTNTPTFTGMTPFSLARGDIFNVKAGQAPITADLLELNNSFTSATRMGTIAGNGVSVNALTADNRLSIDTKGDRDYYRFTAGGTGNLDVNLNATDTQGDSLYLMVYEIKPGLKAEEVPLRVNLDLVTPNFVIIPAGGTGTLSINAVAGREYIVEVLGNEASNLGTTAKSFVFGTARTYGLSINAPAASLTSGGSILGGGGSASGSGGSTGGTTGGDGAGSSNALPGGNVPGAIPTAAFVPVSPDPRSTAVEFVTLNFSEDVTGVDILDLRLTRNGISIPLTASMLTATPGTAAQFNLDVSGVTGEAGTYVVSIIAAGSGIKDTDTSLLAANASDTWVVANAVTTTLDTADSSVGDGVAKDANGATSLRSSIMESNATSGVDVIVLGSGTYTLTRKGRFEDDSLSGDLDIKGHVTIRGVSASATIINAAQLDRIFHVFPGASLTLENLTLTGGEAFDGGGIFNEGPVTDDGIPPITTPGGKLTLKNVNIKNNEAYNQGGGVFTAGTMTVISSAITQNFAGSRGGAVNNTGTSSYLNATLSANESVSRGGGVFNESGAFSGMINVTVADNFAGSRGGGIGSDVSFATQLANSILERNTTDGLVPVTNRSTNKELLGVILSQGNNSIQVLDARQTTATAAGLQASDKFGRDATPLANRTTALQYDATGNNGVGYNALILSGGGVDAGSNTLYPVNPLGQFDAVGNSRLIEGNGDGVITIDQGAVEYQVNVPVALFVATPNPAGVNEVITFNGITSTHPNPAVGRIVTWQWDFDWNPNNINPTVALTDPTYNPYENFTIDATGVSVTKAYNNSTRTSYTVRLIVTDNFGNKGFVDKTITVGVPSKPVVLRPFEFTSDLTPTITWQASPAKYQLRVDNFSTGQLNLINVSNLTTTSYTPTTKLTPGKYKVTVIATNGSGASTSDAYFFNVTQPVLTSPVGTSFDTTPFFKWSAVPDTTRYDLWVSQLKPSYVSPVFRNQFVATNSYEMTTSLGLGTFQWWVRAYDADGNVGDWSQPATFTINRPTITSPKPVTLDTTPTITWTNLGAPRYELWVNQVGGTNKIIYQSALTTNSFTPTAPLPNGTYDVWVRTIAADGEAGLWSPKYQFQMDYRVGTETISPVGVTTDTTPAFTWKAIEGAVSYNLWVHNLTTGVQKFIFVSVPHVNGRAQITYTPPNPMPAGSYRWWVQAVPASGTFVSYSAPKDFQIPVPTLTSPRGTVTTGTPVFSWTGATEFVAYDLWVNNLTTGATQVIREQYLPSNRKFYVPTLPLPNGDFRAWVRGIDKDGLYSPWSSVADFTVNVTVSNAPVLIAPRNVTTINKPTFFWQSVANAVSYEILVKDATTAGQPTVISVSGLSGATPSYTATTTLAPNRTYRWWVRVVSSNNTTSAWSQPLDFRVVSSDVLPESSGPENTIGATQLASVVVNAYADSLPEDDVRSITAHPAGTIVQLTPGAAESFLTESAVATEQAPPVADIDSVMEEFALDSFFTGDFDSDAIAPALITVPDVALHASTGNSVEGANNEMTLEAVTAGLLAALTMPRTASEKDEKRKSQR
jgi:hypothetical protein